MPDDRLTSPPAGPPPPADESEVTWHIPRRTLATVWLTLFLDLAGFGMILPVLPYYAENFGASPSMVALLSTTFSAAQFVTAPVLGRISDRFGRRRIMLGSIAASCGAMLVLSFASALWMVFAARLVSGMGNANMSTANAYVADRVPPEQRARYMGLMGSAIGLGFVFGPAIGGMLHRPELPELPFMVAAGLAAANWLMAFVWLPESRPPQGPATDRPLFALRPSLLRKVAGTQIGTLILLNFLYYAAFSAMESTLALSVEARFGWGERQVGYVFTAIGIMVVLTQGVIVGRLVARFGEKRTLIAGHLTLATGLFLAGASPLPALVVVGTLAMATGNGLTLPSLNALVSRHSSRHDQGLNLGLVSSAAALARMLGPVGAGPLFEALGPGVPMMAGAASVGLAAILAALALGPPPPPE